MSAVKGQIDDFNNATAAAGGLPGLAQRVNNHEAALQAIATQFGIDPVHFGVLCCFNLTIGLISPPVGMTLFVTANVAKVKLTALFKEVIPFVVLGYATLFLITYVPQIVTFIPNLLK